MAEVGVAPSRAYQAWMPPKRGFYVYRMWDGDDRSVYVGMVGVNGPASLAERLRHHKTQAEWWPEVARIDWAEFGNTHETRAEEALQIANLVPAYNRARPKIKAPGAVMPVPPAAPAPRPPELPRIIRPPKDQVSDAEFAEWPYWKVSERTGRWMRFTNDATGPLPGDRWNSSRFRDLAVRLS